MINTYQLSDLLQRISVLMQSDSFSKDYGTHKKYTPIEVHTVGYIADHPGCISGEIAFAWGKTTSAVSQIIKHLKDYGLISVTRDEKDQKKQLLFLTEEGQLLDQMHRKFDQETNQPLLDFLLEKFDEAQIETAIQILEAYTTFYCQAKKESAAK